MKLPRTVIFDLDGTLVDSAPDLTAAMNWCLSSIGRPPVAEHKVRHMVGQGARKLIERGLATTGPSLPKAEIDRLFADFLKFYERNIAVATRPFPGVRETLDTLREAGVALGLCTNKPLYLTRLLLDELALGDYFAAVLGGDSLPVKKPHPEPLLAALHQLGGAPREAVMVGDSASDILAARAARLPVVAVSFGYAIPPVRDADADILIDDFRALPEALSRLI